MHAQRSPARCRHAFARQAVVHNRHSSTLSRPVNDVSLLRLSRRALPKGIGSRRPACACSQRPQPSPVNKRSYTSSIEGIPPKCCVGLASVARNFVVHGASCVTGIDLRITLAPVSSKEPLQLGPRWRGKGGRRERSASREKNFT